MWRVYAGGGVVTSVVLLGLPTGHSSAQSPPPRFAPTTCWVDGDWARDVRRECGWLIVPESRDRADTNTVRLAVEIFRAPEPTEPPRVFLHGGPGGPGGIRMYSEGIARSGSALHSDVVIYDQRGAGLSRPKLCPAYDTAGTSPAARRACIGELEAQGIDRRAYNTAASVADLIDLRRALGYVSWDIFAVSYGARLAQEAMARDGRAIRSVVLASPTARGFSSQAEQPLSTQRALERVFHACAGQSACHDAFPNTEEDFYAVYDTLTRAPAAVITERADSGRDTVWLDGKRFVDNVRDRLLNRPRMTVRRLPFLLQELRSGDRGRAAREIAGDGSGTAPDRALRSLVNCADHAISGRAYRTTLDSVNAIARPPFRRDADEACEEWVPQLGDDAMPAPVRSDNPILIVTGYFDDRTPTEQAQRIARAFSRAYMVEFPDEAHDTRPAACHAAIITQFFADPSRQPDTACVSAIPPIAFTTGWDTRGRGP